MTDINEIVMYRGGMRGTGLKYLICELEDTATAADTVTIDEMTSIKDTIALRLDTGAEVACTEATNVVTIGAGPSDTPMLIIVSGW